MKLVEKPGERKMALNTVRELIDDIRQGKMVILMDDEDRENEGDIVMAAPMVRPEDINFMATHARGLICLTLTEQRCEQLNLPVMVDVNKSSHGTNFTASIEAASGVSTGISAADRAHTVQVAVASNARPGDLVQPGHIFPIKAQPGGVLSRAGHTEAGCDLARLAGFEPAAVIVEVMNEDGTMARRDDLEKFAKKHNIKIGTIADLINYRLVTEKTIKCISDRQVQTPYGEFLLKTYVDETRGIKHFALVMGDVDHGDPVLVRVHTSRVSRDMLGIEPDGHKSWSMQRAMQRVAQEGRGVVVFIYYPETADEIDESVDIALNVVTQKPQQPNEIVIQQVGAGSQILMDLGVQKMRLMSAPFKFTAISGFNLEVVEFVDV